MRAFYADDIKVAVIGGGTGSFMLLSALKERTEAIAALVNMADDGGSTGQLRDELGVLPPGDIRQCLVALANSDEMRDLFNHRFREGALKGHAFGNLFLAALEEMSGNFARGVELAGEVLNITGVVEPITLTDVKLVYTKPNGEEIRGEFEISTYDFGGDKPELSLDPAGEPNTSALKAIRRADIVLIAPGGLYNSLAPALLVPGIGQALAETEALCMYVSNLVTKPGQTDGYTVCDLADELERLAGTPFLDAVLYNTAHPTDELLARYAAEGELAVQIDKDQAQRAHYDVIGAPLLSGEIWVNRNAADAIASSRTLIRHDAAMVVDRVFEHYHKLIG